jgi:hypothetical protein
MTQAEKEKSVKFCEAVIALACSYITAATAAEQVIPDNTILFDLADIRGFYRLLWLGYGNAWVLIMLAGLSFLAAFGLLDRLADGFVKGGEWRLNWALIPFVGTFIFALNLTWYFQTEFAGLANPFVLLGVTFAGGFLLAGVACILWLSGFAYRAIKT